VFQELVVKVAVIAGTATLKGGLLKSLMLLWKTLAQECASLCHISANLDIQTVQMRYEHEGFQFLAVTLPRFAKDLERALEQGKVTPYLFCGFHRRGELPVLLGGFMERVFNRETGVLLDKPCGDSIYAIRQLSLVFGKMQPPGRHPGEAAALQEFVKCEQEVDEADRSIDRDRIQRFSRMSNLLYRDVFTDLANAIYGRKILPGHGPGNTADRIRGNAKFDQTEWTERLESVFPFADYAIPSYGFYYRRNAVHFLEPGAERPSRVVAVPKTYKTPRIIALEPTCMQFMQQGVLHHMVPVMEQDSFLSPFVGFTHQEPNQLMAREGSLHGELATLDLSEASDRVSYRHVMECIGENFPLVREAVDAVRSMKADVPGHGVIHLSKFASMGSAICFPFEEMVFLAIIFSSIEQKLSTSFTRREIKSFAGSVRVYGDDIIVPVEHVQCVIDGLEAFGLKVNVDKSFWNGKFRESCGKEYYDGTDVSIVRVRHALPNSRKSVPEVIAAVETRNQLYSAGLWQTAAVLDEVIEKVLPYFPVTEDSSPALGRRSVFPYDAVVNSTVRMDADGEVLHRPLVRAYVPSSKPPLSWVSGEGALLKYLLKRSDLPVADSRHLERSGRPQSSHLILRWIAPR